MQVALLVTIHAVDEETVSFLSSLGDRFSLCFLFVKDEKEQGALQKALPSNASFHFILSRKQGRGVILFQGLSAAEEAGADYLITVGDALPSLSDLDAMIASIQEDKIILGPRDRKNFSGPRRFGNFLYSKYFSIANHRHVNDALSGFCAIPKSAFPLRKEIRHRRSYDGEMAFLAAAVTNHEVVELSSMEVRGKKSYFHPFFDGFLLFLTPILYALVSVGSLFVDLGLFHLLSSYVFTSDAAQQVYFSAGIARVTSGVFNFFALNFLVFATRGDLGKKAIKYLILWSINLVLSSTLTYAFKGAPVGLTVVKFLIDACIAIANYFINLCWVFTKKRLKKRRAMNE